MKKFLFLLIFCLSFFYTHAQDVIVLKNGTIFKANVLKIEGKNINYTDWDDPEAHTKVITTYDVYSIQYEDGTTTVFNQQKETVPILEKKQPASTTKTSYETASSSQRMDKKSSLWNFHILFSFPKNSSSMDIGFDYGRFFSESSWFWSLGASYLHSNTSGNVYTGDVQTEIIRGSFKLGYVVGSLNSWHMIPHGGVALNYLAGMTMDNESVDLSRGDRTSWSGTVGITIGYGFEGISAIGIGIDYVFPFNSGDGIWFFGIRDWF